MDNLLGINHVVCASDMSVGQSQLRIAVIGSNDKNDNAASGYIAALPFIIRRVDESAIGIENSGLLLEDVDAVLYVMSCGQNQKWDLCFRLLKDYPELPLLVIAESDDPKVAERFIQGGGQEFVVITDTPPQALGRLVRHAVERHRQLSELRFAMASEKILMEELDKKNKELVELSITDGLTGLYNHRFLQERFDFEFKRAKRYGTALSCLLIDIDHFKNINDTYGHQFGDYVLVEIAGILKSGCREVDICGRYGGEEFMVVSSINADKAMKFATKLHTAIDSHRFSRNGDPVHVTVSIGIAEYRGDIKTHQELIERADAALYWAKRDGRNLIRLWKEVGEDDPQALDQYGIEGLKAEFMRLSQQMRAAYMESTDALVRAIDAKDHYTQEHSKNVSEYAVMLARALKYSERDIEVIRFAGLLHDIGKIGISQDILTKGGKLTEEEFAILRKHPSIGANIIKDVKFLEKEVPLILHHHERFDGVGYPYGLKGREIPPGARILAVVDAFDAMITDRVYRPKLLYEQAIVELMAGRGTQFDPDIVDAFVALNISPQRSSSRSVRKATA